MAATIPPLSEIVATVERMEARYAASPSADANRMMAAYRRLCRRFSEDLATPRDIALSRGAALMLIREMLTPSTDRGS